MKQLEQLSFQSLNISFGINWLLIYGDFLKWLL